MTDQEMRGLRPALTRFLNRFLFCCAYTQTFGHLCTYVYGLLSDLDRKSVEPIALLAGTPVRSLQEFLRDHVWSFSQVRDWLQKYVASLLGSVGGDDLGTVGVIDETSVLKKGRLTPGVQRQYLGCVGKVENGIVTVHLAVNKGAFKTLIDGDLFLPEGWSDDRPRCREAGIPDEVVYRPKWRIALEQVDRAASNGVKCDWLTFDEGYGMCPGFLRGLDERQTRFVGEVPRIFSCLAVNRRAGRPEAEIKGKAAEEVVRGARAFRCQPWRVVRLQRQTREDQVWRVKAARVWMSSAEGWSEGTYWLIWASNDETGEEKFFLSNAAEDTPIEKLLKVAFRRWNVEHGFRVAKTELGFGHFEGRTWVGLMRHMVLCLLAMVFVAEHTDRLRGKKSRDNDGASEPSVGGSESVLDANEARDDGPEQRSAGHRAPPVSQRASSTSEEGQTTGRTQPQEAATAQTKTQQTIHCEIGVAL
jgi:SRSO17 transposase